MFLFDQSSEPNIIKHFKNSLVNFERLIDLDFEILGDFIQQSFSLFFLNFQRNSLNRSLLNSGHQVSGIPGDFISDSFGRHISDLFQDLLVEVEIIGQFVVVFLDELSRGSLDGFVLDSSH